MRWSSRLVSRISEAPATWPAITDTTMMSLRSKDDFLEFRATVAVEAMWTAPEPPPPSVVQLARDSITRRAERSSERRTLPEADRLRDELSTDLFAWEQIGTTPVHARGTCLSIDTDSALTEAVAARQDAARRRVAFAWQDERRLHQVEQARALLLDPSRATASWFLDHQDQVDDIGKVATAFRSAKATLGPQEVPDSVGELVNSYLEQATEVVRMRFLDKLRRQFEDSGCADLLRRLADLDQDPA